MKTTKIILLALILCAAMFGCRSVDVIPDSTYGYTMGFMKQDYKVSFDKAWRACERTIASMKGYDVVPEKNVGKGSITATILNNNVRIDLTYRSKEVTEITVKIGYIPGIGDRVASQLIHDRIKENLESGD